LQQPVAGAVKFRIGRACPENLVGRGDSDRWPRFCIGWHWVGHAGKNASARIRFNRKL